MKMVDCDTDENCTNSAESIHNGGESGCKFYYNSLGGALKLYPC